MPGAFNAPRPRKRPSINITSLIDVMFLLLIFFMVSSTFRQNFGVEIELPQAATAEKQAPESYAIRVTGEGQTYFGDDVVSPDQLHDRLERLFAEEPEATVVLEADRAARFENVLQVIDTARQVGGERLIIPTELKNLPKTPDSTPAP